MTGWPNYYYGSFPHSTQNPADPFMSNIGSLFNDREEGPVQPTQSEEPSPEKEKEGQIYGWPNVDFGD